METLVIATEVYQWDYLLSAAWSQLGCPFVKSYAFPGIDYMFEAQ